METNPINVCHLTIDDNIFILNYNKAVVVRDGNAYTNTKSRLQRLVRYKSSEDLHDEITRVSAEDLFQRSYRPTDDKSLCVIENKGFRLHWLCSLHCQDMFIPCRVSGLYFPDTMMGQLLELQYLIECKPDDSYISTFTKALEYSIMKLLMRKVQFHDFTLIPGYSIQLNWLRPRTRRIILSKIESILRFQRCLRIASFEYQRLETFEGIKLLFSLAQGSGATLKELFLWYFFKPDTCPLIGHQPTNGGAKSDLKSGTENSKADTVPKVFPTEFVVFEFDQRNKTHSPTQTGIAEEDDLTNSLSNKKSNDIVNENSEEQKDPNEIDNEIDNLNLPGGDDNSISTWIENWVMDIWRKAMEKETENDYPPNSTIPYTSSAIEPHPTSLVDGDSSHSLNHDVRHYDSSHSMNHDESDSSHNMHHDKSDSSHSMHHDKSDSSHSMHHDKSDSSHSMHHDKSDSSHSMHHDENDNKFPLSVAEDENSNNFYHEGSLIVESDGRLQIHSVVTYEELFTRFHRTSELDLLTEIKKRVSRPVKKKPAKLRSVALCECYKASLGFDEVCNSCQRNSKKDMTYSSVDKVELEREIHQLLYFPLSDEKVYFLDDEKICLQNCHNYLSSHSKRNIKKLNMIMIYRIALNAFTCLTKLSINYNYLADGSGETLLGIGSLRKGELKELEILCTKNDIPSNIKQPHTPLTRRNSIPNIVWKKTKCLCPQLQLHLVMIEISKYNSASLFMSKDMPLTSFHISTGNNVAPVNLLKPGEKLDVWNFDQILKYLGIFHESLVSLTLELWLLPYKTDDVLVKLLKKLMNLERFRYRGPIQSLETINRICDFYLENENITELKIWKIQEPLFRPEKDVKAIECLEKQYKADFENKAVNFCIGSFPF